MRVALLVLVVSSLLSGPLRAAEPEPTAQFVHRPILLDFQENAIENGHFVWGKHKATPAPLAPDWGEADYVAAVDAALASLTSGTEQNASNWYGAYTGETSAACNDSVPLPPDVAPRLVGLANHIYPGTCSATAASGAPGDCAPVACETSDPEGSFAAGHGSCVTLPRKWNNFKFGIGFDPSIDFDKDGDFYAAYGVTPLATSYPNAIVVARSLAAAPKTWLNRTPVTWNKKAFFDDKYYLAIDRSNTAYANRIYVSWDRNAGNNQILYVAYSADGGTSWSAPIKVNDGTSGTERVIFAMPAVDHATGVVYDSWHDYRLGKIFVDKSSNGGLTWGTDVAAATTHTGFGYDIGCVGGRAQGPAHVLKVGPSGALYLVYADKVIGRGLDVLLVRSTDGGATWSTPVTLNDDTQGAVADQFHPTLAVESNGAGGDKVTVSFYDRRLDPSNCEAHVFAVQSEDSGATWSANVRQTLARGEPGADGAFPAYFGTNSNGPGDYSGSAVGFGGVWPFFSGHYPAGWPSIGLAAHHDLFTVKVVTAAPAATVP